MTLWLISIRETQYYRAATAIWRVTKCYYHLLVVAKSFFLDTHRHSSSDSRLACSGLGSLPNGVLLQWYKQSKSERVSRRDNSSAFTSRDILLGDELGLVISELLHKQSIDTVVDISLIFTCQVCPMLRKETTGTLPAVLLHLLHFRAVLWPLKSDYSSVCFVHPSVLASTTSTALILTRMRSELGTS